MSYTLTAKSTVDVAYIIVFANSDGCPVTGTDKIPYSKALNLFAHLHAAHALNALGRIPDKRKINIPAGFFCHIFVVSQYDAQVVGNFLQCTVAALYAACTVGIVV